MQNSAASADTAAAPARERILDAAERVFARDGFAGAAMKAIATEAEVAQGLLHYHFDSKEGLYAAVVARRSALINKARAEALAEVDLARPDALEQVFEALFRPPLGPEGGGADYARIFATLAVGGERDRLLVREHYDPVAEQFIAALMQAEPRAGREVAAWAYAHSIGALIGIVARDGRPERLASGAEATRCDTDTVVARLVAYAAGGLRAMIAEEGLMPRTD